MEQLEMTPPLYPPLPPTDTIAAVSTPNGVGGIAVLRISGPEAFSIVDAAWRGRSLSDAPSHTVHLGKYMSEGGDLLDECVATIFRSPNSFTGEDVVELSVHGSKWIQREILSDLIRRGARIAEPGEFTRRAFLNGRIDLTQAEGIADLIASTSKAAHQLAISQTRGQFSRALDSLRNQLINFASLLELELDFSEEDVEFADREKMLRLSENIVKEIERLSASYSSGAVLKEGVPVVIAGIPNAGKSSLLNLLLNDDKAIVSEIPGTTRDTIEDTVEIDGILFRMIDTAGLRESTDIVENIGIERARARMRTARIIIWIYDPTAPLSPQTQELELFLAENPDTHVIIIENKADLLSPTAVTPVSPAKEQNLFHIPDDSFSKWQEQSIVTGIHTSKENNSSPGIHPYTSPEDSQSSSSDIDRSKEEYDLTKREEQISVPELHTPAIEKEPIKISTKTGEGLNCLRRRLSQLVQHDISPDTEIIVTNARHYEALIKGSTALKRAIEGIKSGTSGDFIAQDVREATHYLGTITGTITTPTLLQNIFSHFCIGK